MAEVLVLRYHRVGADRCTGDILKAELQDRTVFLDQASAVRAFVDLTFPKMMRELAVTLKGNEETAVLIQRTDRAGIAPISLGKDLIHLLLTDPPAAIRALTIPEPQPVAAPPRKVSGIPAGEDTLLDAFGDVVYVPFRGGRVQCPGCGRFSRLEEEDQGVFTCERDCGLQVPVMSEGHERIVGVRVEDLLQTDGYQGRFFLDKPWSTESRWITKEGLQGLLDEWKTEKGALE